MRRALEDCCQVLIRAVMLLWVKFLSHRQVFYGGGSGISAPHASASSRYAVCQYAASLS